MAFHFYEPAKGHGLPHDPFKSIIAPRPIGWVSSVDAQGQRNLAPYSFFNAISADPPMLAFSSYGYKDSVRNIEATGEFVWNLASRNLAAAMNQTSASVAAEIDEFELAGLTPVAGAVVAAPRVAEASVAFECRLSQVVRLRTAAGGQTNNWLTIGEVVGVHIDERLLVDGIFDTVAAAPIMRAGGPADYFGIDSDDRFQMKRPG
ncbi:flavin reductase family protein [Salinisphaera sp. LB1]|uniref:flavin reductase family protein n=1 Tax=Salinisphaera sp. LB1 TaxID=2183911 RepID=UPI000D707315|nr:flavin reductase family protein [Salinisphaera sp. LB1]AWN17290.1 Nitrilotriacetate monooxygenase component B [Salinisphaera sp. LB1]